MRITLPWPDRALHPNSRVHWAQKAKATKAGRCIPGPQSGAYHFRCLPCCAALVASARPLRQPQEALVWLHSGEAVIA